MKKFIVLSSCLLFFNLIIAGPSSLDSSFANNGVTTDLFISNTINEGQSIAIQADSKIVVAGYAGDNAVIVRYNNDGSIDTKTFNPKGETPGTVTINLGTQTAAFGVAINPTSQKIIIVGYVTINGVDNALIGSFNIDGTLDTTFNSTTNTGGYVTTVFQTESQLYGVALQRDGSIVVTGWATINGLSNALVARYTVDGFLDTTFNGIGYITTLIGTIFTKGRAIAIQADGGIVITGQADFLGNEQLVVIRYNSNGTQDTNFNEGLGYNAPFADISLASIGYGIDIEVVDQKIVIVGSSNPDSLGFNNQFYTVLRLNNDGTLDTTFNSPSGYVFSDLGLQASDVIVQPNSQIITCGFNYSKNYVVVVIRFNSDGSIDPTFNFTLNDSIANTLSLAIAMQVDGKIVISGTREIVINR